MSQIIKPKSTPVNLSQNHLSHFTTLLTPTHLYTQNPCIYLSKSPSSPP